MITICYLLALPNGVMPNLEWLLNSLVSNDDGAGFTIATASGQLITEHAIGNKEIIRTEWVSQTDGKLHSYERVETDPEPMEALARRFVKLRKRHPEGPALWHARLATGGVEDTRGCHPFKVGNKENPVPGTVLAHNGIMFSTPQGDWRSDTRIFAEDMLVKNFRKFWRKDVRDNLESYLGSFNKIAIITVNPRFMTRNKGGLSTAKSELFIFNEDLGHWTDDGAWHSNSSYAPFKSYRKFDYSGGTETGGGWKSHEDWKGHGNFNNTGWVGDDEHSGYGSTDYDYAYAAAEVSSQDERDIREQEGTATTCNFCGAKGAVDIYTEVCEICLTCNGCTYEKQSCECYNPHSATQPANLPSYPACQVEPKTITAGYMVNYQEPQPAIVATASEEEKRHAFLVDCYKEWDESDDPAVQAMSWEEFVVLREYEVREKVCVTFQSLDQMETWLADQLAIRAEDKNAMAWLAEVDRAADDAAAAAHLAQEAETMIAALEDEPGILRRLA